LWLPLKRIAPALLERLQSAGAVRHRI